MSGVRFHFLNVGAGDCTIVHFPERVQNSGKEKDERIMMVDLHHHDDHEEYEHIADYYKKYFKNADGSFKPIFRFVCTHPHHDHICGLDVFLKTQEIRVINIWDTSHSFEPEGFDGHPWHENDWGAYLRLRGNDSNVKVLRPCRETTAGPYWDDSEDRIVILNPCDETIKFAHFQQDGTERESHAVEVDEISYALVININGRKIVLAGDGRASPVWENIYEHCKKQIKDITLLKAAHHGHKSGFHEQAVKLMNPGYVIFSNSKEEDEENGAEELYQDALPDAEILKTHEMGTLRIEVPFDTSQALRLFE